MDGCEDVAVCKKASLIGSVYENYGNQDSANWEWNGFFPILKYTGENGKQSEITLVCDDNFEFPQLDAYGEFVEGVAAFNLFSKCACPGKCPNVGPGSGELTVEGLTLGSILLIICLVLVLVYVAGGITYNRVKRQATGKEMLPHPEFWAGLPGLVKDGVLFSWGCVTGKSRNSGYESV